MFKLTAIDQCPVQPGSKDNRPAPQLSAALAKSCEKAGFERYWLAEHHNASYFAGPNPATLISHIASITETIRIGSGGVMLSHYSPYMVAEQFRLLSTLFPNRIDLGIGRAPGGGALSSHALAYPGQATFGELYSRQALDLRSFLSGHSEENHPFKDLITSPYPEYNPELWMLGSSGGSAALAGELGYYLSFALFIAPTGAEYNVVEEYLNAFERAGHDHDPKVMIAVGGYCADTQEEAEFIASSLLYKKTLQQTRGQDVLWLDPEIIKDDINNFSPREVRFYNLLKESFVIGDKTFVAEKMHDLKKYWKTDEFAVLAVTHDIESRIKSYQKFAEAIL